jgi:glucokinase
MREPSPGYIAGVDVGAMKIMAGIFDEDGRRLYVVRKSTKKERGADAVAARVVQCIEDVVDEADISMSEVRAVGIGVPGSVDAGQDGWVDSKRLGWQRFPLGARSRSALGIPVFVRNDHCLSTVGVYSREVKAVSGRVLGLFLGSAIGAGMVVDGSLDPEFESQGNGLGHWVLDPQGPVCACGQRGCFDVLASRAAVMARIREGVGRGRRSLLAEGPQDGAAWRSKELRRAFRAGDPLVVEVMLSVAHWTGRALARVIATYLPEVIILGGGMMEALGDELLPLIIRSLRETDEANRVATTRIMTSTLGDEACMAGAAILARRLAGSGEDAGGAG